MIQNLSVEARNSLRPKLEVPAKHQIENIVGVQFIEATAWAKFSRHMEINIHQMMNGGYKVDRIYWAFPARDHVLCNELITTAWSQVGKPFHCVMTLHALDFKQSITGIVGDIDIFIDRERGSHMVRVLVDLVAATTEHFHSGPELTATKAPRDLVQVLSRQIHADENMEYAEELEGDDA